MILEFLEAMLTPVSREARRLGYLYESIALSQRYRRRKKDWQSHVANCHQHTLAAVQAAGASRRLVVLGSGPLVEVPIRDLLSRFEEIVLVDFVHPRAVRSKWGKHPKVKLVEADILGVAAGLVRWQTGPLPKIEALDLSQFAADFILSANCLSQLPLRPRRHLENKVADEILDTYSEALTAGHLKSVKAVGVAHLVIADYETRVLDSNGRMLERTAPYFDQDLLKRTDSWTWRIAPPGEIYRNRSVEMLVGAFTVL